MKKSMTQDETAQFVADIMLNKIVTYNFDMMYDISKIVAKLNENRGNSAQPTRETMHLMTRDTGCDLIALDDENYSIYKQRNDTVYEMTFCWNRDYFNLPFCIVEQL